MVSKLIIDAFTVCINYSDYLEHCIANKECFNTWTIITHPDDNLTVDLCRKEKLSYVFTNRIYQDGRFCKGKAINDGLLQKKPKNWICHLDADVMLDPPRLKKLFSMGDFEEDCLYGMSGREFLTDVGGNVYSRLEEDPKIYGYFQLWHSSFRLFYSEVSENAGLDDVLFTDSFILEKQVQLPMYVKHLGEPFLNHKGRKSPLFKMSQV